MLLALCHRRTSRANKKQGSQFVLGPNGARCKSKVVPTFISNHDKLNIVRMTRSGIVVMFTFNKVGVIRIHEETL